MAANHAAAAPPYRPYPQIILDIHEGKIKEVKRRINEVPALVNVESQDLRYFDGINETMVAGTTPLMMSSAKGYDGLGLWLVEKGANREARDSDGWTSLYWACGEAHEAVLSSLPARGARWRIQPEDEGRLSWQQVLMVQI